MVWARHGSEFRHFTEQQSGGDEDGFIREFIAICGLLRFQIAKDESPALWAGRPFVLTSTIICQFPLL